VGVGGIGVRGTACGSSVGVIAGLDPEIEEVGVLVMVGGGGVMTEPHPDTNTTVSRTHTVACRPIPQVLSLSTIRNYTIDAPQNKDNYLFKIDEKKRRRLSG
jgi:hypothetical protein